MVPVATLLTPYEYWHCARFIFRLKFMFKKLLLEITILLSRALTRILKIGVKMAPSRNSWSFTIHLYWDFSKSWSQIQKVGVNYSKFGVNETSAVILFLGHRQTV